MNFIKAFYNFLITVKEDYQNTIKQSDKKLKKECFINIIRNLLTSLLSGITAPIIYPIWYLNRLEITTIAYYGTSWQEIEKLMYEHKPDIVKQLIKKNGRLIYWLWTYGDSKDPLGRGGMPENYRNGKNTFWNRYMFGAFRNPRFNINYLSFRTGPITTIFPVIDTRNFNILHKSIGIGDSPDGIYFKWMKDDSDKWYFIYEDNQSKYLFYFGYVDLLKDEIGKSGRFETSYRIPTSTILV